MFGLLERYRNWMMAPALSQIQAVHESTRAKIDQLIADSKPAGQHARTLQQLIKQKFGDVALAQADMLMLAGLTARSARLQAEATMIVPAFKPASGLPFEEALHRLEQVNPELYAVWRPLFENGAKSYVEERLGSCSHREHKYALLFGAYLEVYGHGRILDIGCGPYHLPSYLTTRNPAMLCGLEPLPMLEPAAFEVVRGFNEFLPWGDAQFDVVVSGTSLDHVMSLDLALQEVKRVLKHGGKYIVWLASVPGAEPFNEKSMNFTSIDKFHLFHFNRTWIEPLFEQYFYIDDITILPEYSFDHVFYCMTPRK